MADKMCPECGGPLEPPDDFCQRCLDNEINARTSNTGAFTEDAPWYRRCVPFLTVAFVCCLAQVGVFEGLTRPALKRKIAQVRGSIKTPEQLNAECLEKRRSLARSLARAQAAVEGRSPDAVDEAPSRSENAGNDCVDFSAFGNEDQKREKLDKLKQLKSQPRSFYVFAGVVILLMGLGVLGARSRPLLSSVLAAGLSFLAILMVAASDHSDASWRPHYVLMGLALLATMTAAANGVMHTRD